MVILGNMIRFLTEYCCPLEMLNYHILSEKYIFSKKMDKKYFSTDSLSKQLTICKGDNKNGK